MPGSPVRGTAVAIPLRPESVDLIVSSPPYYGLRSYRDGDEHYMGQVGDEATPQEFLQALWGVLRECWVVLKPSGSCFVNLGDKRAGCVDEATDALTRTGWKRYDQLRVGDEILTLNPDTYLAEWGTVEAVNVFAPEQRLMLRSEGRGHSSLTTSDHRWYIEYRSRRYRGKATPGPRLPIGQRGQYVYEREWRREVRSSAQLTGECRVPIAAPLSNAPTEPKWSDALVEAVAWYWTEGSDRRPGEGRTATTGLWIGQSPTANPLNVARIERCLRTLFGPPIDRLPGVKNADPAWRFDQWPGSGTVDFRLNAAAARIVREHAPGRVPRTEWLASLTPAQLELFIDTSIAGDGWRKGSEMSLSQKQHSQAEAFQTACILSGRAATLSYDPNAVTPAGSRGRWVVQVRQQRWTKPVGKRQTKWVTHEGLVWCPTTSNGSWLARRDGHVFFTGNSGGHNNAGLSGKPIPPPIGMTLDEDGHGRVETVREVELGRNLDDPMAPARRGRGVRAIRAPRVKSTRRNAPDSYNRSSVVGGTHGHEVRAKSKLLLPHRFAIGCEDGLADPCVMDHGPNGPVFDHEWGPDCRGIGWIVRQDMVWEKPNGMPESTPDRTRDGHEYWFHLTKEGDYYSNLDAIREPHESPMKHDRSDGNMRHQPGYGGEGTRINRSTTWSSNLLGKKPSSVWRIPTQPLVISDEVLEHYQLPRHFAAFPQEWPRRLIQAFSPEGICVSCGEGRRPIYSRTVEFDKARDQEHATEIAQRGAARDKMSGGTAKSTLNGRTHRTLLGEACDCTPRTSNRGQRGDWREGRTESAEHGADDFHQPGAKVPRRDKIPPPPEQPMWEYHFEGFDPPAVRPAVILDPFGGTGTTAGVANALGRTGVSLDLSWDYSRLAAWRLRHSGHFQRSTTAMWADRQESLFE